MGTSSDGSKSITPFHTRALTIYDMPPSATPKNSLKIKRLSPYKVPILNASGNTLNDTSTYWKHSVSFWFGSYPCILKHWIYMINIYIYRLYIYRWYTFEYLNLSTSPMMALQTFGAKKASSPPWALELWGPIASFLGAGVHGKSQTKMGFKWCPKW